MIGFIACLFFQMFDFVKNKAIMGVKGIFEIEPELNKKQIFFSYNKIGGYIICYGFGNCRY